MVNLWIIDRCLHSFTSYVVVAPTILRDVSVIYGARLLCGLVNFLISVCYPMLSGMLFDSAFVS